VTHRQQVARLAAPAAFLLAVTIFVLLVRSATSDDTPVTTGPTSTATATQPPQTTTTKPAATTAAKPAGATYTIQSGDTLESIASEYGTSVEELVTLNPAVDPTNLQVGQTIRVP
jgi:peptidoglycan DL-endopeptidase CwlO